MKINIRIYHANSDIIVLNLHINSKTNNTMKKDENSVYTQKDAQGKNVIVFTDYQIAYVKCELMHQFWAVNLNRKHYKQLWGNVERDEDELFEIILSDHKACQDYIGFLQANLVSANIIP